MPWPPEQRRAIAASYRRRGKAIPKHVRDELRGKSQKRRKKTSSARDRLAERMTKRKRRKRR